MSLSFSLSLSLSVHALSRVKNVVILLLLELPYFAASSFILFQFFDFPKSIILVINCIIDFINFYYYSVC